MTRRSSTRVVGNLLACLPALLFACADEAPSGPTGPQGDIAIDIAALQLPGVVDACWVLDVDNGLGDDVFDVTISSSEYGDNGGSATYVGPCDASANANMNNVTVTLLGIYQSNVADCASPPTSLQFQNPTPLTKTVQCLENADVQVDFNVAILRDATQGFFDIAVSFGNVFCSSKVDCCRDDNDDGTCDEDINLLHDAGGVRNSTVVAAFACASGDASADTFLYMIPNEIVCDDVTVATILPEGEGNRCSPAGGPCANITDDLDLLYQVGVYRGKESFSNVDKVFWNVALGVNKANLAGRNCTLQYRATADDNNDAAGAQGGLIPAGDVYPYVDIAVPLSNATHVFACAEQPLGSTGVTTTYTPSTGPPVPFPLCYDPEGGCGPGGCICPGGFVCNGDNSECLTCQEFSAPFETDPTLDGWTLEDTVDPNPGTTVHVSGTGAHPDDGYIQLTAEVGSERGIVYNSSQVIPAGDASIEFEFRLSDGPPAGTLGSADGLAMTIVQLHSGKSITDITNGTEAGGGIGYNNAAAVGPTPSATVHASSAVTIEIDQFLNTDDGTFIGNEPFVPHIAVHKDLNSRPSGYFETGPDSIVELPGIVDSAWHTARVDIVDGRLRIFIDGDLKLETTTTGSFEGGHIFFSSSTGGSADRHDIDAVRILGACE